MALLPDGTLALVGLALVVGGVAILVAKRDVPKSTGIAFLLFLVFALQLVGRLFLGGDDLPSTLGLRSGAFVAGEQWWAPLTYMFVHADFFHLFGNLLMLVSAGPIVEDRIGGRKFLLLYAGAGLAAVVAHLAMTFVLGVVPPWAPAVGASGALFGVLTVLAWHWPRESIPFPFFFILWLPSLLVLVLHLTLNLALMFSNTSVAWYGHFAGFLVGLAAAPLLKPATGRAAVRSLPDPKALEPLATTTSLKEILVRLGETSGTAQDDAAVAEAWLDRFFAKARCPDGHPLEREGMRARCRAGEFEVRFARKAVSDARS